MGIKDVFSQAPTPVEEVYYKQVLDEMDSGIIRQGIWGKALADSLGDEGKAKSLYIKYRVQSLVDEEKIKDRIETAAKAKIEEYANYQDDDEGLNINNGTDEMNPILKGALIVFIPLILVTIIALGVN